MRSLATATMAALLFGAADARAAGLPALVVHRTDDVASCPDARALAAQVADQMHRPALTPLDESGPRADGALDVQIYKSEEGFTAVIQAGKKTRKLSDKGPTCGGLAAALAISIAVMLDTEALPPAPEPPPKAPEPEPLPPVTWAPEPKDEDRPAEPRRFRIGVAASGVVTDGLLNPLAGGVVADLELRVGRLSITAGALALPGQSFSYGTGQVTVSLVAGTLRGCVAPVLLGGETGSPGDEVALRFSLCLDAYAGSIHGTGEGYHTNRTLSLPWAAGGASALFTQRIWGPLAWGARLGVVIPFLQQTFSVDHVGPAFTPTVVGGALDAGLRVSIW